MIKLNYGEHPNQHIDVINEGDKSLPWLIFIHGGAWRDPNNTSEDILTLSKSLNKRIPLASIEYRLSPVFKNDSFVLDSVDAINLLIKERNIKKISLVGHSAGAHIISHLLNHFDMVESMYLLDGIYSLDELIKEYPSYIGFVSEAFDDYSSDSLPVLKFKNKKIHLIQSFNDELLSMNQSYWLMNQFIENKIDFKNYFGDFGKHEDVYKHEKIAEYINATF